MAESVGFLPNQITITDVRPGTQFVSHHPHLKNDGGTRFVFEITDYPTEDGWVKVKYAHSGLEVDRSLADAGIIPYQHNGRWNTNWWEAI